MFHRCTFPPPSAAVLWRIRLWMSPYPLVAVGDAHRPLQSGNAHGRGAYSPGWSDVAAGPPLSVLAVPIVPPAAVSPAGGIAAADLLHAVHRARQLDIGCPARAVIVGDVGEARLAVPQPDRHRRKRHALPPNYVSAGAGQGLGQRQLVGGLSPAVTALFGAKGVVAQPPSRPFVFDVQSVFRRLVGNFVLRKFLKIGLKDAYEFIVRSLDILAWLRGKQFQAVAAPSFIDAGCRRG